MPSTVISSFQYEPATLTLTVVFVSGMVYNYKGVPEKLYHAMRRSGSKGIFLNNYIKGHYEFEKVG